MNDPAVIEFPTHRAVPRAAVIGAGLSGLICAERLIREGWPVTIFDKGRGPGGRLSTRRADELRFDHGAQYFTARDQRFRDRVAAWVHDGVVALWNGRIVRIGQNQTLEESPGERFVGTPGMNAPARALATVVEPQAGVRVASVTPDGRRWRLEDERGGDLGSFDRVAVAVPSPRSGSNRHSSSRAWTGREKRQRCAARCSVGTAAAVPARSRSAAVRASITVSCSSSICLCDHSGDA